MKIKFYKYQATGNDFIMIDNRGEVGLYLNQKKREKLCKPHLGIGADGLILLKKHDTHDFEMVYYNADGRRSSMCGNGGRCAIVLAKKLKMCRGKRVSFIVNKKEYKGYFTKAPSIKIEDIFFDRIEKRGEDFIIDTGSPHYVHFVDSLVERPFVKQAKAIRHSEPFAEKGINVNFVSIKKNTSIEMRTFERGVEDETYSCGTGALASAIIHYFKNHKKNSKKYHCKVITKGGVLKVSFFISKEKVYNILLSGPVKKVFTGTFVI